MLNLYTTPTESIEPPTTNPVRISSLALYDDDSAGAESLYSNITLTATTKTRWHSKTAWQVADLEPSPANTSGAFRRILKSTVQRKVGRSAFGNSAPHGVTLNLHQFQTDSGESLGEDPERWAKLTF